MTTEDTVLLQISDTGTPALEGLSRPQLHAFADALRQTAANFAPGARILTRFDVRFSDRNSPLVIDLPARDVIVSGKSVPLSHTEFEILSQLARNPRVVVSRADLTASGGRRSVDVHLSRVRTKLGSFGRLVTTVRGTGYRFDPEPGVRVITELSMLRLMNPDRAENGRTTA
ncbi:winged helix-turn-helix domain-containing protein [Rhodococcus sp. G-MC3]|uniref:winged helix-turn-helix domain-containing protein n=1 Tax=Rhodococcus sp. G-MC3 TaxID=3046209 RepID=UPI0024BAC7DD|nr:winged helix-turn-helix domain-containing protein [Rhodococcus sp. G-MC3]MDJ0393273.1 winged helix-turn-helix domain-containing protein [Rhodococcus sp. G-MC3]